MRYFIFTVRRHILKVYLYLIFLGKPTTFERITYESNVLALGKFNIFCK
jgi:hypothetical protein